MLTRKQRLGNLLEAIEVFLRGQDRSIQSAQKIEELIADIFPDDDRFEDAIIALASYTPGGGDYLYDEQQLSTVLEETRQYLSG